MGLWIKPEMALLRLVEDDEAPIMARVKALQAVPHPPRALLRRLIIEPKIPRKKPIPSKLRAVATFAYEREMKLTKTRKLQRAGNKHADNPLGII